MLIECQKMLTTSREFNVGDLAALKTEVVGGPSEPLLVIKLGASFPNNSQNEDISWIQKVFWLMRPSGKLLGPFFLWELKHLE